MIEAILGIVAQVLRISVPYALAATGGALSERGGVINIALEGILLTGAFGAAAITIATGEPWLGVLGGMLAGAVLAALHGLVTVWGRADQILSGLALNLLALGATRGALKLLYESASNSGRFPSVPGWGRSQGPLVSLLGQPLFLLSVLSIVLAHLLLFRTRFGLALRAAGDGPRALDGTGLSVNLHRFGGVLLSGLFGGLAGTWLVMEQHSFTDGMSNGRGYIALAAMIVGKWRPFGAGLACLLFGAAETLQIRVDSEAIPTQLLQALPYLVTLVVLAGWIGRAHPPLHLGEPYERERGGS